MSRLNVKEIEAILLEDIGTIYHNFEDKIFNGYVEKVSETSYNIVINNFGYKKISQRETFLKFTISRKMNLDYGIIYKFTHDGGDFNIVKAEDKRLVKQSKSILLDIAGAVIQK